ncbi:MAG: hypothetical protein HPY61_06305 [Methanotrichaceae archaeon]|nr:hypothetical protein [Methanotrichaceae archaeon]
MRSVIGVLLLMLALSVVQASPLQGGNDNVKCTLFEVYRTPGEENGTVTLKLDVGLLGAENATYELLDSKDQIFRPTEYKSYQPGRQMLVFQVPEGALFKLMKVTPTAGAPFNMNWWLTPKGTGNGLTLRYYGLVDWLIEPELQAVSFDVSLANGGDSSIFISPENFTLLDQWGWPYYTTTGFSGVDLEPQMAATHIKVSFVGVSPFSRPSTLVYDYLEPNQIAIDLDKDLAPLSDDVVYGTGSSSQSTSAAAAASAPAAQAQQTAVQEQAASAATTAASETPALTAKTNQSTGEKAMSLKDEINASKERLNGVNQGTSSGNTSTVSEKIGSSIDEAKARLEAVRKGLAS